MSWYAQIQKNRGLTVDLPHWLANVNSSHYEQRKHGFDVKRIFDRWAPVVGAENIMVASIEGISAAGADVIEFFLTEFVHRPNATTLHPHKPPPENRSPVTPELFSLWAFVQETRLLGGADSIPPYPKKPKHRACLVEKAPSLIEKLGDAWVCWSMRHFMEPLSISDMSLLSHAYPAVQLRYFDERERDGQAYFRQKKRACSVDRSRIGDRWHDVLHEIEALVASVLEGGC